MLLLCCWVVVFFGKSNFNFFFVVDGHKKQEVFIALFFYVSWCVVHFGILSYWTH